MKMCSIVVELKSSVVRIFWICVLENHYIEKKQENGLPSSALIFLGQPFKYAFKEFANLDIYPYIVGWYELNFNL
jgi:hypothetical protein